MKRSTIIFTALILVFVASACAQTNDWDSKKYDTGEFTKIYLEGGFKVYLVQGKECGINVKTTNDGVFDDLIVRNENGKLHIKMDREFFHFNRIELYITFDQLEQLDIEGGANLKTNGYIDLRDFSMSVEGGAKIEMNVKADNMEITGEGGFLFELEGVANNLGVKISGAGHVDANELKAQNVDFRIEGFGTGSVHAVKELNARIEGVGKIRYKGDPKVTQYIDGLGSVKRD